jgi:hypothetical protein
MHVSLTQNPDALAGANQSSTLIIGVTAGILLLLIGIVLGIVLWRNTEDKSDDSGDDIELDATETETGIYEYQMEHEFENPLGVARDEVDILDTDDDAAVFNMFE